MNNLSQGIAGYSWPQIGMVALPIAGWIFSKLTRAMPEPVLTDTKGYIILYNLIHELAANDDLVAQGKATLQVKESSTK